MVVAVTGGSGQLGQALQSIAPRYRGIEFYFAGSEEADITNKASLMAFFEKVKPDFCINAAAYTAVDKAESEPEKALLINVEGVKNLAGVCNAFNTTMLHISTDFVFDGTKTTPYLESDETNPQSVYGLTKRDGEREIQKALKEYYIIRTSWLYSKFGNNFMKTMLRLAQERPEIAVVADQKGSPTSAVDLAEALMAIIQNGKNAFGIYHYSNEGETTWYDFARTIFKENGITVNVKPISAEGYPAPAKRPAYSVLGTSKIRQTFNINISGWASSLKTLTHAESANK